ncbi:19515_t:CDS:1 [Cetraspora pellucida]|uniref:19515_t:CDS:1 n=1 Tax=Cetraspora pellucida TaxID=1433469 RepID=A0A9N8Z1V7_9GLOM|nr:19515_t:CDS:1 [Cetraspora pellucida]
MGLGISREALPSPLTIGNPQLSEKFNLPRLTTTLVCDDIDNPSISMPLTSTKVQNLIREAEHKLEVQDVQEYSQSIILLQQATILGSAYAATKLGALHLNPQNTLTASNYLQAAGYYSIALKLVLMIPCKWWDLKLLLDIISDGWYKLFRSRFDRQRDLHTWNHGIKLMKQIDKTLKDPNFIEVLTHKDNEKWRAIRINLVFCYALTAEADNDYPLALKLYQETERIGSCGLLLADKLIKKAHTKYRLLESRVPRVQPVCVQCGFEAKELTEIWRLLVCPKCQIVACCNRDCLANHFKYHQKFLTN